MATFWITKWALSEGIIRADRLEIVRSDGPKTYVRGDVCGREIFASIGYDAHHTEYEAKKKVVRMVEARRKSLKNQLRDLEEIESRYR